MSARWIKCLCVCAVSALVFVACGSHANAPKTASAGKVASEAKAEQPKAAMAATASEFSDITYKGSKTVFDNGDNVIAVITEENLSALLDTLEEDKSEALMEYLEHAIDFLNDNYIAKTEHAKDAWIAYQRLDEANDGSVRIDLGLANDRNQAKKMSTSSVSGSFSPLAKVKITAEGNLFLTDKGKYKDTNIGSIGHAPQ